MNPPKKNQEPNYSFVKFSNLYLNDSNIMDIKNSK